MKDGIKTLFLTRQIPYPPMGGAALRNWQNINIAAQLGTVAVFSVPGSYSSVSQENFPHISLWQNCPVTTAPSARSLRQKVGWWLEPSCHPLVDDCYRDEISQELKSFLQKFQPDLIIFEELWLYLYLPTIKEITSCPIVLDQHNIEANLLTQTQPPSNTLGDRLRKTIQNRKLRFIEQDFVRKADQVWVCSQEDADLLKEMYDSQLHVRIVPNGIEQSFYAPVYADPHSLLPALDPNPHTLFFAGTFSYPPNQTAAHILIDQILPKLQQHYANARLLLVGKSPTADMLEASHRNKNVIVTGRVDDIRPYMAAASVAVVPLLQGGGTRLKVLEAFAARMPVVTTSKGIEGIEARDNYHVLIRDPVDDIVEAIDSLWSNQDMSAALTEAAISLLQQKFSREVIGKKVEDHVNDLICIPGKSPIE
ncbi:MAG: glycosyltransferase family 4 protein [Phormidesmis sp.]